MAIDAGTLEIKMLMGLARLQEDVTKATAIVGRGMAGIQTAASAAKAALGALGIGLGVGALVAFTKSAIDAADHLNDLSKSTSIAVETLAGLKLAAKQSGGDLDSIAASINKLSVEMGKSPEKFRALGISAKEPLEAFKQLSDIFVAIEDPQMRAALGAATLGKSWAGAAPLLAEGSARIGEMVAKGTELSGMTQQMASDADSFNDQMAELNTTLESTKTQLVADLLPGMNDIAAAMREAAKEGGLLTTVWVAMGGAMAHLLGLDEASQLRTRLKEIDAAISESVERLRTNTVSQTVALKLTYDEQAKIVAQIAALEKERARLTSSTITAGGSAGLGSTDTASQAQAAAKAFLAKAEGATKAAKAVNDLALADEHVVQWMKQIVEMARLHNAEVDRAIDLDEQQNSARESAAGGFRELVEQMEFEVTLLGKSNAERQVAIALRQLEKAGLDATTASVQAYADRIRAAVEAQEAFKLQQEAIRAQAAMWDDLASAAGDFFSDLIMNGKSAFDNLKRWVKELLAQMIALFAKRWILQLAGVAGGASVGGNSMAGGLMDAGGSALASWAGGAAMSGGAGMGLGASAGAGMGVVGSAWSAMGAGVTALETGGVAVSTGAMAGSMSGIYTALAAIPVWGWIAMAVIAAVAFFSGRGGGPKVEGSFASAFDASGQATGGYNVSGEYGNRFFAPSGSGVELDEALGGPIRELNALYGRTLTMLGGTRPGSVGFGLGVSNDPRGDAPSMLASDVSVNGASIFRRIREMDDKEIGPEMMAEMKRMLLAALQASDLPEGVAEIINSLDVENATSEQIDAALNLASAYQRLGDVIAAIEGGPIVALEQQLAGMKNRIEAAQTALADSILGGDHATILAAEQELERAIIDRYNTEFEMIRNLQAAIRATEEMAYQFALDMAGRINAVGGSRDIAGIAMGRAGALRGRVGGAAPTSSQLEDVQGYVGAIDTWYNARRDQIMQDAERQAQAQSAAAQAIAAAQSAAAQARVNQLTKELEMAQAFQGVVERAKALLEELTYTTLNPAPLGARLSLYGSNVDELRSQYEGATGGDRAQAASRLLEALRAQLGMLGEMFQRPSEEYLAGYNAIVSEISGIQDDAKPQADRMEELQQAILQAQQQANVSAAATATAADLASGALDALNSEALPYYEWAEAQGTRLFEIQRIEQQALLDTITGGMEPNLYIAQRSAEMVEELRGLRDDLREGLAAPEVTVNITEGPDGELTSEVLVNGVKRNATVIKRILATA